MHWFISKSSQLAAKYQDFGHVFLLIHLVKMQQKAQSIPAAEFIWCWHGLSSSPPHFRQMFFFPAKSYNVSPPWCPEINDQGKYHSGSQAALSCVWSLLQDCPIITATNLALFYLTQMVPCFRDGAEVFWIAFSAKKISLDWKSGHSLLDEQHETFEQ